MVDDEHGDLEASSHRREQPSQVGRLPRVEAGSRLVQEQQPGLETQSASDLETPLETDRQVAGGRIGAGIAAELGTMKVTEQIDALRALATNPVRKLVVPRVLATTVMMPLLTLLACFIGIFGGLIIAVGSLHLSSNFYIRSVIETVKYNDLTSGVGKTIFFGFAIGLIACYNGLSTTGGADGVGRSTTATVVTASITVLILDFFLTKLFLFIF